MPLQVWVLCLGPALERLPLWRGLNADGSGEHAGGRSSETRGRAGLGGCVLEEGAVKGKNFPPHSIFIL